MGKRLLLAALSLVIFLFCVGCSDKKDEPAVTAVVKAAMERESFSAEKAAVRAVSAVSAADPKGALSEIYAGSDMLGVTDATDDVLEDKFYLTTDLVDEYYIRYISGIYGVADTYIIKPADGEREAVLEALDKKRLDRIREYETMDIHNSSEIAKNALIYEQGDYIVMIAHADNEAVKAILDRYLPH